MFPKALSLLLFCIVINAELFNKAEREITLALAHKLQVFEVVLINKDMQMYEYMAKNMILTEHSLLKPFVDRLEEFSLKPSLLVWKSNNYTEYTNILLQRPKFIWVPCLLLFPTTVTNVTAEYDSLMILATETAPNKYSLTEVYSLAGIQHKLYYGHWTEENGLITTNVSFVNRRKNFMGLRFGLMTLPPDRYPLVQDLIIPQREVLSNLAYIFNFSYVPGAPGVFSEAPMALLTFGANLLTSTLTINLYVKKMGESKDSTFFWQPFEDPVWAAIGLLFILSTVVSLIVSHFSDDFTFINKPLVVESLFRTMDAFSSQDGSKSTSKNVERISQIVLRATAAIIIPAYCACITSFMAVEITKYPFTSLEGLAKDGTYHIGGEGFSTSYFGMSGDPFVRMIGEKFLDKEIHNASDGIPRMCIDPKYVHLGYNTVVEKAGVPCKVIRIPTPVTFVFQGAGFPDDFVLLSAFREKHVTFFSNGQYARLRRQSAFVPNNDDDAVVKPVDMELMQFAILVVPGGAAVALIILLTENIIWFTIRCRQRRKKLYKSPTRTKKKICRSLVFRKIDKGYLF